MVSEETGIVSICHRGKIERNFDPESLKRRLGELFLQRNDEKLILNNWAAKIASLVLAIILWFLIKKNLEERPVAL